MSGYPDQEWDDGTPNWHANSWENTWGKKRDDPKDSTCQRVPTATLMQGFIWIDSSKKVWPINEIKDGHLDNIIRWLLEHNGHWTYTTSMTAKPGSGVAVDVYNTPLYKALVAEQKQRIPVRNKTPRAALKDVMLNDVTESVSTTKPPNVNHVVNDILNGLKIRGYEIRRIPGR